MLPDPVETTEPACALPLIGDVVIFSPLRKFFELLIFPVTDPSRLTDQRERVGTPAGALAVFVSGVDAVTGLSLLPKNEKEGLLLAGAGGACTGVDSTFFPPPNILTVGAAFLTGAGGSGFG